ncbi:MAG: hypothetical protein IJV41_10005 [Oscillospiraceae bacterium]|nr:hypothetical protein [Oscillospiraceae bacterium]
MFGYLVAAANVLPEAELQRYRACYCGLCRSLEHCFSQTARLTLNYDMTFLVLLLGSLYEPAEAADALRCPRHPMQAQPYVTSAVSDYAAHMNIAMAYLKCLDDWKDDRRLTALAEAKTLEAAYREVQRLYPRQCAAIEAALDRLSLLEQSGEEAPDAAADCFGALMEEIFVWREDRWAATLRHLAHALGRFIYLMDAVMDLDDDLKSGSYNPFKAYAGDAENEARFRDILKMQLGECLYWFDKLPLVQDEGLMKNILCVGLWVGFNQKYSRKDP